MDGGNNDIYYTFGGMFEPLRLPFNVAPQVAPAGNSPVEGAVPPVMAAAPAGNLPVERVVPPEMAAAPAVNAPVQGAVSPEMAAGPVVYAVPISVVPPAVTPGTGGESVPGTGGAGGADTSGTKKRGRSKKYDNQENLIAPSGTVAAGPSRSGKKGQGWAAGFGNLQSPTPSQSVEEANLPLSMVGWGFTLNLITVETGEDVAVKIATFAVHNGSKGICILSGSGTVSRVSIRQIGVSGGSQTYEGLFQIMALSGSFSADSGIRRGRAGGLSVALSGANGRIIGGGITGTLVASSPITVAVGTFVCGGDWQNRMGKSPLQEPASATPSAPGPRRASAAPAPPVNPEANIFVSPTQAGHVVNPGSNMALQETGEVAKSDDSRQ